MEIAYILFVLVCIGIVPAASVLITTIARVYSYRKKGNSFKFQYHISDILAATFCLGTTAAITRYRFPDEPVVLYFTIAAGLGILAGKLWHLTSVRNSLGYGAVYIAIGTLFWTFAAAGSGMLIAVLSMHGC